MKSLGVFYASMAAGIVREGPSKMTVRNCGLRSDQTSKIPPRTNCNTCFNRDHMMNPSLRQTGSSRSNNSNAAASNSNYINYNDNDARSESNASFTGDSHHDHESNFDPGLHQNEKEELQQITRIAQNETRNLWLWKIALLGLMLITAGLVSAGTYVFINDAQENDFVDGVRISLLACRLLAIFLCGPAR
jgi:hypothetical protein